MGTFGTKPFDNDSAMDLVGNIEAMLCKAMRKAFIKRIGRGYYYEQARAAAYLTSIIHDFADFDIGTLELARDVIDLIGKDETWIGDFRKESDRRSVRANLDVERSLIANQIHEEELRRANMKRSRKRKSTCKVKKAKRS